MKLTRQQLHDIAEQALARREGKPWSDEEDNRLVMFRSWKLTFADIAIRLRRTKDACNQRYLILCEPKPRVAKADAPPERDDLLEKCLDHFDAIVDGEGCSFRDAMDRCGMVGEARV